MRFVRRQMRRRRGPLLSVPQFRVLAMLRTFPTCNLSAVADFLGASRPTTSRIVSNLVAKRFVARTECCDDRRHVELVVTPRGARVMADARRATRAELARQLIHLDGAERAAVLRATRSLQALFSRDPTARRPAKRAIDGDREAR
jgi:DNA-binding MarR family transcriptional regulator